MFAGAKPTPIVIPKEVKDKEAAEALRKVFVMWTLEHPTQGGKPEMDSRTFSKLLKQAKLVPTPFSQKDCDLVFTAAKERGTKLLFPSFLYAIFSLAEKKNSEIRDLLPNIEQNCAEGPKFENVSSATKKGCDKTTGPGKFFYDKSTFTGAHKAGGPSTRTAGEAYAGGFSNLINRDAKQDDALQRKKLAGGPIPKAAPKSGSSMGSGFKPPSRSSKASKTSSGAPGSSGFNPPSRSSNKNNSTPGSGTGKPKSKPGSAPRGPEKFFYDKSTFTGSHSGKTEGGAKAKAK